MRRKHGFGQQRVGDENYIGRLQATGCFGFPRRHGDAEELGAAPSPSSYHQDIVTDLVELLRS
jgi:hypothetical protein